MMPWPWSLVSEGPLAVLDRDTCRPARDACEVGVLCLDRVVHSSPIHIVDALPMSASIIHVEVDMRQEVVQLHAVLLGIPQSGTSRLRVLRDRQVRLLVTIEV